MVFCSLGVFEVFFFWVMWRVECLLVDSFVLIFFFVVLGYLVFRLYWFKDG